MSRLLLYRSTCEHATASSDADIASIATSHVSQGLNIISCLHSCRWRWWPPFKYYIRPYEYSSRPANAGCESDHGNICITSRGRVRSLNAEADMPHVLQYIFLIIPSQERLGLWQIGMMAKSGPWPLSSLFLTGKVPPQAPSIVSSCRNW